MCTIDLDTIDTSLEAQLNIYGYGFNRVSADVSMNQSVWNYTIEFALTTLKTECREKYILYMMLVHADNKIYARLQIYTYVKNKLFYVYTNHRTPVAKPFQLTQKAIGAIQGLVQHSNQRTLNKFQPVYED